MTQSRTFALLNVPIQLKVHDEPFMVLHTELATGKSPIDNTPFSLIQAHNGSALYLKYNNQCYELSTVDLVGSIFDQIKENK